jgi:YggT family protein
MVVLVAVVLSWIQLPPDNPLVRFTSAVVDPVLEPIRRFLPSFGGFDLSPMVLLLTISVLRRVLGGL